MKYTVVDSMEFTYPDVMEYKTSACEILGEAVRGARFTFQILLEGLDVDFVKKTWLPDEIYLIEKIKKQAEIGFYRASEIKIECDLPFEIEWFSLVPVSVEQPTAKGQGYPNRISPYRVYDCLRPFDNTLDVGVADGRENDTKIGGLYGAVNVPENACAKVEKATVKITYKGESVKIPLTIKVHKAKLPEETLKIIQGYGMHKVCEYHGVEYGSLEYDKLDQKYLKACRRMHQNMMYMHGAKVIKVGENKYEFDFSKMKALMKHQFEAGIKYFNLPSIGVKKSWREPTILLDLYIEGVKPIPAMSYEGYCLLAQYLPQLHKFLEENGWLSRVTMGVCDEPTCENATEYRALCGLVRKFVPDIKLLDALGYADFHGALDVWVFQNSEYDLHQDRIETLRSNGEEIWHYVCLGPRNDGYINRFMDYPLLATRYLLWGNYKHNLGGYLHWAVNMYQPGQDPFRQNFPMHNNVDNLDMLPPGDSHLFYPGENDVWLSVRAEAQREGAEDYEMLKVIAKKDKAKADEICNKAFRSFKDVEYDVKKFRAIMAELLQALDQLQ